MTSHFINYFARRADAIRQHLSIAPAIPPILSPTRPIEKDCTFCEIVAGLQEAFVVFEDEHTLAFLDILPIRTGHVLVIPKAHYQRVSHLPDEVSAAIGRVLPRIARALCSAMNQPDFNIVSNQGYAQIVHHVHYHLVPAPLPNAPIRSGWASVLGRDELDEDEAKEIVKRIKEELAKEIERDRNSKI